VARLRFGSQINQAAFVDRIETLYGDVDGVEVRQDDILLSQSLCPWFEEVKQLALDEGGTVDDWT